MMERQVTVDGHTYELQRPFFVLATQNPFEFEGTYPLPENQLDRFMLNIDVGYPDRKAELDVLNSHRDGEPVSRLKAVLTADELAGLQRQSRQVRVDDAINDYILDIVETTRKHEELSLGVSTRGAITFYRAVQALALSEGRAYAVPDDVKKLAVPALAHRITCRGMIREGQRERSKTIIRQILNSTRVPD
jgi:MoxR-like ATPase